MNRIVRRLVGRVRESQEGFTLIEMLIVVGIIVALAAAIVPQVVQFGGKGEEAKKTSEESSLQTAIFGMMDGQNLNGVDARQGASTKGNNVWNNATTMAMGTGSAALNPSHYPATSTEFFYCWDALGEIFNQLDTSTDNCGTP